MKRKKEKGGVAAVCQLRNGDLHPFGAMRGFVPLGGGEERVYREMREAIPVLDIFLDNAFLANLPSVRIIHGKGTGVLRAGVHDHLRRCKNVKRFRVGVYGEGENGVTIAELA